MTSPLGGARRRRRPVAVPAIALTVATGLGVTVALGGLRRAPEEPPRRLGPGASLDQGGFTTRFVESRAVVWPNPFGGMGRRFLEVELQVTNRGDATVEVGAPGDGGTPGLFYAESLLRMTPAVEGGAGPVVSIPGTAAGNGETGGDDGSLGSGGGGGETAPSRQLHPDLPATVVLRYELPDSGSVPPRVRLDVGAFERREGSFTHLEREWSLVRDGEEADAPPKVVARVTLPVRTAGRV
ncbi:hypothetical protein [Streptosporangium sp. NPDC006007]|uniref:hypothetical protein n=1 Tax=Streptosporangium sp. NPDC006007 TaxID=3154575 RepID=UPI0033B3EAD7